MVNCTVAKPAERNVIPANPLASRSLLLARHPGDAKNSPKFYLRQAISLLTRSRVKHGPHNLVTQVEDTLEVSEMDLWIVEHLTVSTVGTETEHEESLLLARL